MLDPEGGGRSTTLPRRPAACASGSASTMGGNWPRARGSPGAAARSRGRSESRAHPRGDRHRGGHRGASRGWHEGSAAAGCDRHTAARFRPPGRCCPQDVRTPPERKAARWRSVTSESSGFDSGWGRQYLNDFRELEAADLACTHPAHRSGPCSPRGRRRMDSPCRVRSFSTSHPRQLETAAQLPTVATHL